MYWIVSIYINGFIVSNRVRWIMPCRLNPIQLHHVYRVTRIIKRSCWCLNFWHNSLIVLYSCRPLIMFMSTRTWLVNPNCHSYKLVYVTPLFCQGTTQWASGTSTILDDRWWDLRQQKLVKYKISLCCSEFWCVCGKGVCDLWFLWGSRGKGHRIVRVCGERTREIKNMERNKLYDIIIILLFQIFNLTSWCVSKKFTYNLTTVIRGFMLLKLRIRSFLSQIKV